MEVGQASPGARGWYRLARGTSRQQSGVMAALPDLPGAMDMDLSLDTGDSLLDALLEQVNMHPQLSPPAEQTSAPVSLEMDVDQLTHQLGYSDDWSGFLSELGPDVVNLFASSEVSRRASYNERREPLELAARKYVLCPLAPPPLLR